MKFISGMMGDSCNLRSASASSLFRYFVCVIIYRENPDSQRKVVGNYSTFLTAQLKISINLAPKLERQLMENLCFKTESLAMSINCSYSLIEKSSIWNERMKGFLSLLLSVLLGGKYFANEFRKCLRWAVIWRVTPWCSLTVFFKIFIHHI